MTSARPVYGTVDLDDHHCRYHVEDKSIAVRIDDRMCVAHVTWMTEEHARAVIRALSAMLDD